MRSPSIFPKAVVAGSTILMLTTGCADLEERHALVEHIQTDGFDSISDIGHVAENFDHDTGQETGHYARFGQMVIGACTIQNVHATVSVEDGVVTDVGPYSIRVGQYEVRDSDRHGNHLEGGIEVSFDDAQDFDDILRLNCVS